MIWDTPAGPGVQTCGLLIESHVPAQAIPLAAIVTTAVLLEKYETGWVRLLFALSWGCAVKDSVAPTSIEAVVPGVSTTFAGVGYEATFTPEPLLQPVSAARKNTESAPTATGRVGGEFFRARENNVGRLSDKMLNAFNKVRCSRGADSHKNLAIEGVKCRNLQKPFPT